MGNRGCLHDDYDHPVRHTKVAAIVCVLDFKGRTRAHAPGHFTSLFFSTKPLRSPPATGNPAGATS
jgi:hypothetical protein